MNLKVLTYKLLVYGLLEKSLKKEISFGSLGESVNCVKEATGFCHLSRIASPPFFTLGGTGEELPTLGLLTFP